MAWFYVPPPIIRMYASYISTLRAQEALMEIPITQVGTGSMKRSSAQRVLKRLDKDASRFQKAKPANPSELRAVGINIEHVESEVN